MHALLRTVHVGSGRCAVRRAHVAALASVEAEDVRAFERILGPLFVRAGLETRVKYGTDWLRQHATPPALVLLPANTAQVAAVVRHCRTRRLGLVPFGGNTGLVGGSVPHTGGEVTLSLERLHAITSFDSDSGIVTVQAGVVLETLDAWLADRGFAVPLDLGSKASCQLGGNVSTAAAGLRFLRYGSLHGSVTGLRVVTGGGDTLEMLSSFRKDAVGYDLKQLFIGSEGTLGIITDVSLQAVPRPVDAQVAVLAINTWEDVRRAVHAVHGRGGLGEVLSALEYVDKTAMRVAMSVNGKGDLPPLGGEAWHPYYVLVEAAGSNAAHDAEKMGALLGRLVEGGIAADGVLASSATQAKKLWSLREGVPLALARRGWVFKWDVSLRLAEFPQLVAAAGEELRRAGFPTEGPAAVHAVGYGHLGDGNLHLNVSTAESAGAGEGGVRLAPAGVKAALDPFVYEWVLARAGSVSAEHGLGQDKAQWLARARPPAVVAAMRALKSVFDPSGVLNPGKVLSLT